jgi:tRNA threonylcarbamoyladenosine biosynthesis protein TsaB
MHSLYVDSTSGLVIGLLDSNFKWIEYKDSQEKKPSEVIHIEIYNLIKKHNLNLKEMNYFFSAGPGSYTGMRLGEGIAQILAWDDKKVFSFHHFDAPRLIGIPAGFWVTNAFKGQVFIYNWNESEGCATKELVDSTEFKITDSSLGYTLSRDVKDFEHLKTTKDLIHLSSQEIFSKVFKDKMREAPYYFRTLDEEFKHA